MLVGRNRDELSEKLPGSLLAVETRRAAQSRFRRSTREVRTNPCNGSLHVGRSLAVSCADPAAFAVRSGLARIRVEAALRPAAGRVLVAGPAHARVAFSDLVHRHPVPDSADRPVPAGVPLSALRQALHRIRPIGVVGGRSCRSLPSLRPPPRSPRRSRRVLVAEVSYPEPEPGPEPRARGSPRMVYGWRHG